MRQLGTAQKPIFTDAAERGVAALRASLAAYRGLGGASSRPGSTFPSISCDAAAVEGL